MRVSEKLRNEADELVRLCSIENVDAILLVKEALKRKEKSTNSAYDFQSISKEEYSRLALKVINSENVARKVPKEKYLSVGISILYILHMEECNVWEFIERVADALEITSEYAKAKMFPRYYNSLPSGLSAFLYVYNPEKASEWYKGDMEDRFQILKETERKLIERIKAETNEG